MHQMAGHCTCMVSHVSFSLFDVLTWSVVLARTMHHAASVDEARALNLRAVVFAEIGKITIDPSGQRKQHSVRAALQL